MLPVDTHTNANKKQKKLAHLTNDYKFIFVWFLFQEIAKINLIFNSHIKKFFVQEI